MTIVDQAVIDDFRIAYPLFSDIVKWPDAVLEDALCQGDMNTPLGKIWGAFSFDCDNRKRRGMYLYAAHVLVTTYPVGAENPEDMVFRRISRVTSKTVGDESSTFSLTNAPYIGADWLESTTFGQQFSRMARQFCVAYIG